MYAQKLIQQPWLKLIVIKFQVTHTHGMLQHQNVPFVRLQPQQTTQQTQQTQLIQQQPIQDSFLVGPQLC